MMGNLTAPPPDRSDLGRADPERADVDSPEVVRPELEQVRPYLADHAVFLATLPGTETPHQRALRRDAIARFAELGFPTPRMEDWRHTNVAPIAATEFMRAGQEFDSIGGLRPVGTGPAGDRAGEVFGPEVDAAARRHGIKHAFRLVFVNGRFAPALSSEPAEPTEGIEGVTEATAASMGVSTTSGMGTGAATITSLARATARTHPTVEAHIGRYAKFDTHAFAALNTAYLDDGAFIHLPKGCILGQPIQLLFLSQVENHVATVNYPRTLIVLDDQAEATVVETYASVRPEPGMEEVGTGPDAPVCFTCAVTEIVAGPESHLDHYKVQSELTDAFHMATLQITQDRASQLSSHAISTGGGLVRHDVNAVLDGEGADSNLNGLYLVGGHQQVGNYMRVEHAKPHCSSHELYKGILEGQSRAVFNGRIYVHPGAQKTDAKQANRNLLLSEEALVNSNPQLEIFANDVKCTHGSTVGQLDEDAIFYLRSRGIDAEAAKSLLIYAFASDIVDRIKVESLRHDLEEFLFRRLPMGDIVRQAV